ncbi:zinc finger protein 341-like [Hetaerina americana]|uniref:zinc finger protein 341-like n=1 Tax=Hetaerina americana TaxID=62018 RepID=UPI003A7F43AF
MASSIFDTLTGVSIDSQTALTVQSLLDQNPGAIGLSADSSIVTESETPITLDEEDVFQCGKCKKQFISLPMFLCHKKESSCLAHKSLIYQNGMDVMDDSAIVSVAGNSAHSPTSEAFDVTQLEVGQPIILEEADMLSFSIDQNSLQLSSSSQALPSLSSAMQGSFLDTSSRETAYGDLKTPTCIGDVKSPSSGFNMNIGGQPIFVTTQLQGDIPSPTGGFVVTTTGPLLPDTQVQAALPTDVGIGPALPGIDSIPTSKRLVLSEANIKENDLLNDTLQALTDEGGGGPGGEEVVGLVQDSTEVVRLGFLTVASTCTAATCGPPLPPPIPPANKKKHKCDVCGKTFAKNFDFQQHMRSHTGERPFQCVVCGRAFSQKSNVKKHMLTHRVWPSGLTNTLPSEPIQVISLESSEEDKKELVLDRNQSKDGDNVQVVIDSSYVCQYCNRAFRSYLELKSHMKDHSNEKMFKCIQRKCGKTFADLDEFLLHTKSHSSEEVRYRCHVCCRIFKSLSELGTHQYSHFPSNNPDSSPDSNAALCSGNDAGNNVISSSKGNLRQYRCGKCRSYFATPEALEHHNEVATHHHPCPHCKRIFHCERYLRRHLVTHGTARILAPSVNDPDSSCPPLILGPYECDICSKTFRTERYLANHRLIHYENRPHSCPQCSASFNRRDKLMRHQLIHEPVKRYKCPFRHLLDCKKEFNRQDKLKLHISTHNSVKKFSCTNCSKTFQKQNLFDNHKKSCVIKTEESQPACNDAELIFMSESSGVMKREIEVKPELESLGLNYEDGSQKKVEIISGKGRGRRKRTALSRSGALYPPRKKAKGGKREMISESGMSKLFGSGSEGQDPLDNTEDMIEEDGVPTLEIIVVPVPSDEGTVGVVGPYKIDFPSGSEYSEDKTDQITLWPDTEDPLPHSPSPPPSKKNAFSNQNKSLTVFKVVNSSSYLPLGS